MLIREAMLGDEAGIARVHVDSWRETYGSLFDERFFGEKMFERRLSFWRDYLQMRPRPGENSRAIASTGATVSSSTAPSPSMGPTSPW